MGSIKPPKAFYNKKIFIKSCLQSRFHKNKIFMYISMILNIKKNITYKNDNQKTTDGEEKEFFFQYIKENQLHL